MTKEAIQKDVSEPRMSNRDAAMAAIIESRKAEKESAGDTEPKIEPETNDPGGEPAAKVEGEQQPPEEPTMVEFRVGDEIIRVPATATYRAKIDGKEVDQTVENIARSYQKGASADRRLEEATRRMKEAEAKATALAEKESKLTEQEKSFTEKMAEIEKRKDEGTLSEDGYKVVAQKLIKALTESETPEEDLAAALKDLAPAKMDSEALLNEAEQRIEKKVTEKLTAKEAKAREEARNREIEKANAWFDKTYNDIAENEQLMGVAKTFIPVVLAENPGASQMDIARLVGEKTREWHKKLSTTGRPAPPKTPSAVTVRASIGRDAPKPKTRQETLNEMRAARGQPTM